MERVAPKSVDEYIAGFPPDVQDTLRAVRAAIREAAPEAEEVISYQMPAYRLNGWMIYFAGFAKHFSLFCPYSDAILAAFANELRPYKISKSKATIQFPLDRPAPMDLIRRMAEFRAAEFRLREPPKSWARSAGKPRPQQPD